MMKHSKLFLKTLFLSVTVVFALSIPAVAQDSPNATIRVLDDMDKAMDSDMLDNTNTQYRDVVKTYNTELYNRGDFEPDNNSPRIIADPNDIIELDNNTRIIRDDDDDSDIYAIN